jgi:16S rRNA (guanine527-N7)-methyltransferase
VITVDITNSLPEVAGKVGDVPEVFAAAFPAHVELMVRYASWLAGPGIQRGLLGPREADRLWDRHLLNSVAITELIPAGERLVDIGSGAGLPGIALACARPDLHVDLVEPLLRRSTFLSEVVRDLALGNRVRVVRGRADDSAVLAQVRDATYVTARAVASLQKLSGWVYPMLASKGNLLAIKGDRADEELQAYRPSVSGAGLDIVGVVECGQTLVDPPVRVVHLRRR